MNAKKVYFVRHGETDANMGGLYQSPDVSLSARGQKGACAVAERCTHLQIDVVIASPYMRAQQTGQCISSVIGKPLLTFEYAHEVVNSRTLWGHYFASDEGKAYEKERREKFTDPSWGPDGAENYFDVSKRTERCVEMLEQDEHSNIVLVSHGNFLRFLLAYLLLEKNADLAGNMAIYRSLRRMSNVAITEFLYDDEIWKLITWNDNAHFAE